MQKLLFSLGLIVLLSSGCCQKSATFDSAKAAKEIKGLLASVKNLEVKVINNKVVLDGFTISRINLERIEKVLKIYSASELVSLVSINETAFKKLANEIESEIDNPNIYVAEVNGSLMLEGSESYIGESKRAEEIAQALVKGLFKRSLASDAIENRIMNNIMKYRSPALPISR